MSFTGKTGNLANEGAEKLCKDTTFFSYMQARANFFIFFIKSVKSENRQKKSDN